MAQSAGVVVAGKRNRLVRPPNQLKIGCSPPRASPPQICGSFPSPQASFITPNTTSLPARLMRKNRFSASAAGLSHLEAIQSTRGEAYANAVAGGSSPRQCGADGSRESSRVRRGPVSAGEVFLPWF